ncbi:MAG: pyruvate dehydrogenase complex dihydrolipoamide acetyltransferase [Rhodobacteraceae bacterium]|nr:pyruvate dehydrogenase complex dihydrolipoamide acetyltransferase [Paracoccaceae bacterium]
MPIEIKMPALSPTMEEGTIATWLVAEGDEVKPGDVLAEIETDKATMEFEATEEGTLARILVEAGSENVAVNSVIALLAVDGEDAGTIAAVETEQAGTPAGEPIPAAEPETTTERQKTDKQHRTLVSPLARRIAVEKGIDLARVSGSGPRGRIVRIDVEAVALNAVAPEQAAPVFVNEASSASASQSDLYAGRSYDVVELNTMRRTIARRLTEAEQTVPHFYLRSDVELDALLALRMQLNDAAPIVDGEPVYKTSVNDMVIKALALSLAEVPDANVTWGDGNMRRHHSVDVSVAVSIEGGLITPIIRDAQAKSISTISTEMKDLATRARARQLTPEEFQGGTTSVSNLGMFGVSSFDAVINPPQGTILAVGAGERRPVSRGDVIESATVMTVTLSVDHRLVDGALGAELLAVFKRYVEAPLTILS